VLKADLEIYVGVYLIVAILIGRSSFMNAIMFWQMMRLRYMMNTATQLAFQRFDATIHTYLAHQYCPRLVQSAYATVKTVLSGMVDAES
jgi:hypothetical protein